MEKSYDIIGMGVCAFDVLVEVDRFPGRDEKLRARRVVTQGGGLVGTALVAAARLGGRCAYLGALGDDSFAESCAREFEAEGVATDLIRREKGSSVVTAFIVADRSAGTRMILYTAEGAAKLRPEEVAEEVIAQGRVLHVDNFFPETALKGARIARSLGVPVTMDMERRESPNHEFVALGDYVIVPLGLAADLYGASGLEEAARALYEKVAAGGGRMAVVTDGTRGSLGVHEGGVIRQPAYRAEIVDTTGCGDVYHGAFALGVARGWEPERTMAVASATAALKCRKLGGRQGIPTMREVEEFLESAEPIE
ncbi:MAG: PfkB family carbohydrate kinase [Armatimonadota bacterium]|jgi:sugar/nucleoside kinase (ribokinase family)